MLKGSIASRILWLSTLWLVIALAATAFLLSELYSRALDNALLEQLDFQIESLVGEALQNGVGGLSQASSTDPRFARPASGWYWQVSDAEGHVLAFSPSLVGSVLPQMPSPVEGKPTRSSRVTDSFGTPLRAVERTIALNGTRYHFIATGNLSEIADLVGGFRGQAIIVLGAVGAMLAIMSALVARFALRPVTRLRLAFERVREGEEESVAGTYPTEIAPLAEEVNELLASNKRVIERARSQVGNLAHGLKTPIAVLRNEASAEGQDLPALVLNEADKMAAIVSTYLDRAQIAARTTLVGRKTPVLPTIERLVRVMRKIHKQTQIEMTGISPTGAAFRGEQADLEEMLGNLLDNACKWASGRVRLSASQLSGTDRLEIAIEDDGPGLSETEIATAVQRGKRLDEHTPGSGLGLDIVREMTEIYGGELRLTRSSMGGLKAALRLPATRSGGKAREETSKL